MSKFSSWLSKRWGNGPSMSGLESSIKGTGRFAGEVGQYAAPLVSIANPLLGAAIAGGSAALRGKSVTDMLKDAALTGGSGYLLGHAGDIAHGVEGMFGDATPAADAAGSVASGASGAVGSAIPDSAFGVPGATASAASPLAPAVTTAAPVAAARTGAPAAPGFFSQHGETLLKGAGQGLLGAAQLSSSNAQSALERRRLADEEAQQNRLNTLQDAQFSATNPMRQALLAQLMARLNLPGYGATSSYAPPSYASAPVTG